MTFSVGESTYQYKLPVARIIGFFDPLSPWDLEETAEKCAETYREDLDGSEEWEGGDRIFTLYWDEEVVGKFRVSLLFEPVYETGSNFL